MLVVENETHPQLEWSNNFTVTGSEFPVRESAIIVSMGTAFQAVRIRRTWDRRLECLKNSKRVDMPSSEK